MLNIEIRNSFILQSISYKLEWIWVMNIWYFVLFMLVCINNKEGYA